MQLTIVFNIRYWILIFSFIYLCKVNHMFWCFLFKSLVSIVELSSACATVTIRFFPISIVVSAVLLFHDPFQACKCLWLFLIKYCFSLWQAGNILIDSNGTIKLADFGVAACMFDAGDRQRSRNTFVGTPCWYSYFEIFLFFLFPFSLILKLPKLLLVNWIFKCKTKIYCLLVISGWLRK